MNGIRKEVLQLISVNEKIQSTLLMGERLQDDEREIVKNCANELLQAASDSQKTPPGAKQMRVVSLPERSID